MLPTKDRIIAAATMLLDAGGPSAVTLRAVGDAAGISQSAPYRHYPNKRALLDAMVRQIIQQMREMVETAKASATTKSPDTTPPSGSGPATDSPPAGAPPSSRSTPGRTGA